MTEQWQELKETIIEMRDNDGTGTQQQVCYFLAKLMDVLEKQMQETESYEDCISRKHLLSIANEDGAYEYVSAHDIANAPSVKQQEQEPKTGSDAISRQAVNTLVDELARAISDERCFISRGRSIATIMQDILDLPSVNPKEPKAGWIPVSERLPEDIRPVMVTWKNNDPKSYYQYIVGKHFIGVAHYLSGKWFWYSSTTEDFLAEYGRYDGEEFDEAIEVVAWCPLPEPYKEG